MREGMLRAMKPLGDELLQSARPGPVVLRFETWMRTPAPVARIRLDRVHPPLHAQSGDAEAHAPSR